MAATEIVLVTGERYMVEGTPEEVEAVILGASRGSIMQLAWLTEAAGGRSVGVNPVYLVTLRAASGGGPERPAGV